MLTKLVLLLFCGALINAKSLVQRDPRLNREIKEGGFDHVKFPGVFKDLMRGLENDEVEQDGYDKVGVNPLVQLNDDEFEEKNDELNEENEEEEEGEEDEEEEENPKKEENENSKKNGNEVNDDEDDDEEEEEDGADEKDNESNKETQNDEKNETLDKNEDESDADDDSNDSEDTKSFPENAPKPQPSNALVGSQNLYEDSFKFAQDYLESLISASKNPETQNLVNVFAKFLDLKSLTKNINLESLMKSFPPQKKSSPKHQSDDKEIDLFKFDQDSLLEHIKNLENNNEMEDMESSGPQFDLDDPSVGSFMPQSLVNKFNGLQKNFPQFANFWKKNPGNVNTQKLVQKDAKVGFGGWNNQKKLVFGDLTKYVNKAVEKAQAQLEQNGRVIPANNPDLTINVIPAVPITFKLKRVEGANTLDTYGQSKGIHYNKLYAFTQYKFTELRYYYDVMIKPLNLFTIRKSIAIILNDAPTKMSAVVEEDNKMKLLGMEFVNPVVSLDVGSHRYVNYGINWLVNEYLHPVVKQKLVEIVSRDSKLLLTKYLQDAQ
ncbi:VID27-like protein [Planococcus citri]|uniref:VID27-like protein n=1 Tax=Planococcus citri TaxID=170843 RepID=UPI0031F90B83